jgi:hypothetical protein
MLGNGRITSQTDTESTCMRTGQSTKGYGKTTYRTEWEWRLGSTGASTRVFTRKARNKAKGKFLHFSNNLKEIHLE